MLASSYRYFHARPRLLIGMSVAVMVYFLAPKLAGFLPADMVFVKNYLAFETVSKFLIAWNIGVWVYLISVFYMMYHANDERIHHRALSEDEGTGLMLVLALIAAIISITAIIQELGVSKDAKGGLLYFHVGLTFTTIVTAWLFIHTMFALHYSLLYYTAAHKAAAKIRNTKKLHHTSELIDAIKSNSEQNPNQPPPNLSNDKRAEDNPTQHTASTDTPSADQEKIWYPLDFPHEDQPVFWDFLYFSYIIGTSGQTADVAFSNRQTRQLGTVHCVLAYFFNTAILALMINLASGLFGS